MYTLLCLKCITNKDLLYSTGNSAHCYVAAWMSGVFWGKWIHVYVWLSPFSVHLKLSHFYLAIGSVQFSSVAQSCPTLCESVMPSSHLILCRPLLLLPSIFPSIRVFSNESALRTRWPKYQSFSFNVSLSSQTQD